MTIESRIDRGMQAQLQRWRQELTHGRQRLGWKIGFNTRADQQRLQLPEPMVGFLTRERLLEAGSDYAIAAGSQTRVEAEVAVRIGTDVAAEASQAEAYAAIEAFAPALEIVDVSGGPGDIEAMLSGNLFHRGVVIGDVKPGAGALKAESACVRVNGREAALGEAARLPEDLGEFVAVVARRLARHREALRAGDWIICGAVTQPVDVQSGDAVVADLGPLGSVSLNFL